MYLKSFVENYKEKNLKFLRDQIEDAKNERYGEDQTKNKYSISNSDENENKIENQSDMNKYNQSDDSRDRVSFNVIREGQFGGEIELIKMNDNSNSEMNPSLNLMSDNISNRQEKANDDNFNITNSNRDEDKLIIRENKF